MNQLIEVSNNKLEKDLVLITDADVRRVTERSALLKQYIKDELKDGVDYGFPFPGAPKATLLKAGAEKLAKLFRLGSRILKMDSKIDWAKGFGYFECLTEIYHIDSGVVLAQCVGSTNSKERKFAKTPFHDAINTLQKMAQKRSYVGAVISAVGASEFYTQDLEDIESSEVVQSEVPNHGSSHNVATVGEVLPFEKNDLSMALEFVVTFGKFNGKKIAEIPAHDRNNYAEYIERTSNQKNQKLQGGALQFVIYSKYLKGLGK